MNVTVCVSSSPCQLMKVAYGSHWDAMSWPHAVIASARLSPPRPHPRSRGCQETSHSASPLPSCTHSQPVSVTGPGPWRWSTEKSAEGQLSGEAKWARCPSVAENVGRKIKCDHVQIITPMCTSLSTAHLFFIICLSTSGGPVDPRHTVGAQKGAKHHLPSPGS